jgi:DNA-nicking Smr family endonuclease
MLCFADLFHKPVKFTLVCNQFRWLHGRFHNTFSYAIKEQYLCEFTMKKRRKKKNSAASNPKSSECFNAPFADLDEMLKQTEVQGPGENQEAEPERAEAGEEDNLFRQAMADVETLDCNTVEPRGPGPLASPSRRPLMEEELEAYAQLVDLVSGDGSFDIQFTEEYIEGAIVGADPELLPKLRCGDFSVQAHYDLHGMTASEAREAVERFILASVVKGLRCVLIIHGRGLNSQDQMPVLKERMSSWLKRGRLKRLVLAFATAQPCDGGAGAMYVLLRKRLPMVNRCR